MQSPVAATKRRKCKRAQWKERWCFKVDAALRGGVREDLSGRGVLKLLQAFRTRAAVVSPLVWIRGPCHRWYRVNGNCANVAYFWQCCKIDAEKQGLPRVTASIVRGVREGWLEHLDNGILIDASRWSLSQ
jgi:hypothetical protein